ncbi:MAG: GldG family protein [Clostridiaceae bacterium]|nr:GldG family protein [Clostridiaceae bacterium]
MSLLNKHTSPKTAPAQAQDRRTGFRASFRTKAFRMGTYSVAVALVVIGIAFAVNLVAGKVPSTITQLDMTSQGIFTLSDQTKETVSSLNDEVTVYWIVQNGSEDASIGKLLRLYEDLGKNLKVVEKDPVVYPGFTKEYTDSTVNANSLIVVSGTRSKLVDYYDIYAYDYDSYYSTGQVSGQFCGENVLTGAISYVTSDDLPLMYMLQGHGESALSSDLSSAVANENITTKDLSLLTETEVPEDCDLLLICSPKNDLAPLECDALRAYLQRGGKLLLLTDFVEGGLPNLTAVLSDYGVNYTNGVVLEGDNNYCAWGYSYYLLPDIGSHTITYPLSSNNYHVILPVASGLTVQDNLRDGLTVTELLTTSDTAFSKAAGTAMTTYDKETGDTDGPFALGVAIDETQSDGSETRIVWYTSSQLLDDTVNSWVGGANSDLFLNSLGWMSAQDNAVTIRSRDLNTTYLTVPNATASALSAVLIGIVPLVVLAVGVVIAVRRKRR